MVVRGSSAAAASALVPTDAWAAESVSPGGLEALVLRAFRSALGDDLLEPNDDFFAAGGDSILAVSVAGELAGALSAPVPVALVFMNPTPAGLADAVDDLTRAGAADAPAAR